MFDETQVAAVIKAAQNATNVKTLRQDMMAELGLSIESWTNLWTHICTLGPAAYQTYLEKGDG